MRKQGWYLASKVDTGGARLVLREQYWYWNRKAGTGGSNVGTVRTGEQGCYWGITVCIGGAGTAVLFSIKEFNVRSGKR